MNACVQFTFFLFYSAPDPSPWMTLSTFRVGLSGYCALILEWTPSNLENSSQINSEICFHGDSYSIKFTMKIKRHTHVWQTFSDLLNCLLLFSYPEVPFAHLRTCWNISSIPRACFNFTLWTWRIERFIYLPLFILRLDFYISALFSIPGL